jgi:hypothetical protein
MAIGDDGHTDAGTADEDGQLAAPVNNPSYSLIGEIGIIHRFRGKAADIIDLVTGGQQRGFNRLLEQIPAVIGSQRQFHFSLPAPLQAL